jgi:hypothetical protein
LATVAVVDSQNHPLINRQTTINVVDAPLTDTTPPGTIINSPQWAYTGSIVVATFTDGNPSAPLSDFAASVDFGGAAPGTTSYSVQLVARSGGVSKWKVVGSATYTTPGDHVVAVNVSDVDGSTLSTSNTTIHVAAATTVLTDTTLATTNQATEGTPTGSIVLTTFTDNFGLAQPGDFTIGVNWGGNTVTGSQSVSLQLVSQTLPATKWKVVGSAIYTSAGGFTPTVTVSDIEGGKLTDKRTKINVAGAPLTDTTPIQTFNAVEGNSTGQVVLATFSDANRYGVLSDFKATVNWGAALIGTPTVSVQFVSQTGSASNWQVVGSAIYSKPGLNTVAVTVKDADGMSVQTSNTKISVADAPLTDTTSPSTIEAVRGRTLNKVVLATFTDGNPYATAADFNIGVTWGGASVAPTPVITLVLVSHTATSSNWAVLANVTFLGDGLFTADVTINDVYGFSLESKRTKFHVTG